MKKLIILLLPLFLFSLFLTGCSNDSPVGSELGLPGGGLDGGGYNGGATPGGVQNLSYIRELIDQGYVPQADNFLVEGIYSEYDLPLQGAPSENTLTIRTACGYSGDSRLPGDGLYVQLGLSSNIDVDNFQRPPLNVSVVLDRSGSMQGGKIKAVKKALNSLIDKLDESDMFSLVIFNHQTSLLIEPTAAAENEKSRLKETISEIVAEGNTNIDAGLRLGYNQVYSNVSSLNARLGRVILFTDMLPNTGNTEPGNFKELVSTGASDGVGLTAFGAGIDFDQELMDFIATQANCNYMFLATDKDIEQAFENDFDFMVSPLVNDLSVTVQNGDNFKCKEAYGFPGEQDDDPSFEVKTVFLSRRRGALMLKFEPRFLGEMVLTNSSEVAIINLSYREINGEVKVDQRRVIYRGEDIVDGRNSSYEQDGVRTAVALTREILGMQEACRLYRNDGRETALAMLSDLTAFLQNENEVVEADLQQEIDMVSKLRENIRRVNDFE